MMAWFGILHRTIAEEAVPWKAERLLEKTTMLSSMPLRGGLRIPDVAVYVTGATMINLLYLRLRLRCVTSQRERGEVSRVEHGLFQTPNRATSNTKLVVVVKVFFSPRSAVRAVVLTKSQSSS